MLTTAVLITVGFLPVYLWLRAPFMRLPLHIDTGFYVSNHTIATGRIDFSKGWNSHFAGCSKVVPELFYSLIYLAHGRGSVNSKGDSRSASSYRSASRIYASLFNYLTAIAVGVLALQLGGGDIECYYAGLIVFSLLSSEPQYGVYFECGELFSLLGNVVSLSVLYAGLTLADPWLIGLAALIWALEAFFVKLSSVIAMVVVFGWVIITESYAWGHVLAGCALATSIYTLWIIKNGRTPLSLLRPMGRHESAFGQRADWRTVAHRLSEKGRCLVRSFYRQPVIPVLALAGAIIASPAHPVVWIYLAAVLAAYAVQATDCWYYQIPLLPSIALLAGAGAVQLISSGSLGIALFVVAAAIWLWRNQMHARRLDRNSLNRWCWHGYRPENETHGNVVMEEVATEIGSTVSGNSLLVYGPYNQAYALLNASYPTPIVAPEYYMDDVCPGWQETLSRQLVAAPPEFILDTSGSFAAQTARDSLGLDYRLTHVFDGAFRLYRLTTVGTPQHVRESADTYCPQSRGQLVAEEELAPDAEVRQLLPDKQDGQASAASGEETDVIDDALPRLLHLLARDGYERIGVYGAGRFTIRHADLYRVSPVRVAVILDDRSSRHGSTFLDWPLAKLEDADSFNIDAIIVSTDRFARLMEQRVHRVWRGRIPAFTLDVSTANRQQVDRPNRLLVIPS